MCFFHDCNTSQRDLQINILQAYIVYLILFFVNLRNVSNRTLANVRYEAPD